LRLRQGDFFVYQGTGPLPQYQISHLNDL